MDLMIYTDDYCLILTTHYDREHDMRSRVRLQCDISHHLIATIKGMTCVVVCNVVYLRKRHNSSSSKDRIDGTITMKSQYKQSNYTKIALQPQIAVIARYIRGIISRSIRNSLSHLSTSQTRQPKLEI